MGKIGGFMEFQRKVESRKKIEERIKDYNEFTIRMQAKQVVEQGARCMNCGVPFCHSGCPLGNIIPDFNHAVYSKDWEKASNILHSTNNFPEFTGRLCPAPCESACVLSIIKEPVSIENIEKNIVETAFEKGYIRAKKPKYRTGKKIAVVGSGPSGLAAAQQLNYAGHEVTIFERDKKMGGLLRYGIPNFKLEKWVIDRRLELLKQEGIKFKPNTFVGKDINALQLETQFDAVLLTGGSTVGRKLQSTGSNTKGVHLAMDFLKQSNMRIDGNTDFDNEILASGKNVIVIGGGDTGSDCVGTSIRQGAKSVKNFEIMPQPPVKRPPSQPWPYYPMILKTSSSHEEGAERFFQINTKEFIKNDKGELKALHTVDVEFKKNPETGRFGFVEIPKTEKKWNCELVLLALGFVGPETDNIIAQFDLKLDERGNVWTAENSYKTSKKAVFAAGDMRRGQSLIVWAISEGREAAHCIDKYLMGYSELPTKGSMDIPRIM